MNEWKDIATAKRDGTLIEVAYWDGGWVVFPMLWDEDCENPLVGAHSGMWRTPNGSFTWDESRGEGPTHWREIVKQ